MQPANRSINNNNNKHAVAQDPATQAAILNKGHTILLIQFSHDDVSKTFIDYDDVAKSVDGLCQLYE